MAHPDDLSTILARLTGLDGSALDTAVAEVRAAAAPDPLAVDILRSEVIRHGRLSLVLAFNGIGIGKPTPATSQALNDELIANLFPTLSGGR